MAGGLIASMALPGFVAVTRTYDSGSGTDTIPTGASQVILRIWGPGGPGGAGDAIAPAFGGGGGSGGYSDRTITLVPGNWGLTFNYATAVSGGTTTLTNGTFGTVVNMQANSGDAGVDGDLGGQQGAGGLASGGVTNTAGNGSGGVTRTGAGAPNGGGNVASGLGSTPGGGGGGGDLSGGSGGAGANGRVRFIYS